MTAPNPDYVAIRPMVRLGVGLTWSSIAAEIERDRRAALAALPVPHPLRDAYVALAEARTRNARLRHRQQEWIEVAQPAPLPVPEPSPPSRRGWLLRAIEGIFG